jgi:type IV fimbrial biogenesis protein FimT
MLKHLLPRAPVGRRSCQSGVTAVELIFTVALLAVLMPIAVPSFTSWLERYRVRGQAEAIHSGIQLARAEALARNTSVRFRLEPTGNWAIYCIDDTKPGCPTTTVMHEHDAAINAKFDMSVTVAGSTIATTKYLTFNAQGRPIVAEADRITEVNLATPSDQDSTSASRELRIVVSNFGRTRMCYPHAPAGNPTRCEP